MFCQATQSRRSHPDSSCEGQLFAAGSRLSWEMWGRWREGVDVATEHGCGRPVREAVLKRYVICQDFTQGAREERPEGLEGLVEVRSRHPDEPSPCALRLGRRPDGRGDPALCSRRRWARLRVRGRGSLSTRAQCARCWGPDVVEVVFM